MFSLSCKQNIPNINSAVADTIQVNTDYLVAIFRDQKAAVCVKATGFYRDSFKIESYVFDTKKYKGIDKSYYYVFTNVYKSKNEAQKEESRLTKIGLKPKIFELEKNDGKP